MTAESIKTAMEEAEDFELSFEEEVMRLAGLSPFEYEQQRKPAAKALKIERVVFLDQAVKRPAREQRKIPQRIGRSNTSTPSLGPSL